jgi:HAD superfamily hydrolase (TIGR01484 family)
MVEPKHFFFDLDNTLCESRQHISEEMEKLLCILSRDKDVVIVSGAKMSQIRKQIGTLVNKKVYILSQNGNYARNPKKKILWKEKLDFRTKKEIMGHINFLGHKYSDMFKDVPDVNDLIQDRGCQISFSWVGHNAPKERKDTFDADRVKRKKILKDTPFVSDRAEVSFGGTTCFDYTAKGKNKGTNVKRLAELKGWNIKECIYVGDAIFPGGNDGSVIGICPTHLVKNPEETTLFLQLY